MFLFCLVFAMSLYASVYMCFLVTCWERADLLALLESKCCYMHLIIYKKQVVLPQNATNTEHIPTQGNARKITIKLR